MFLFFVLLHWILLPFDCMIWDTLKVFALCRFGLIKMNCGANALFVWFIWISVNAFWTLARRKTSVTRPFFSGALCPLPHKLLWGSSEILWCHKDVTLKKRKCLPAYLVPIIIRSMLPITVDTGIGTVDLHIQQAHSIFGCSVSSKKTHHKSCLVKLWTYFYAFVL